MSNDYPTLTPKSPSTKTGQSVEQDQVKPREDDRGSSVATVGESIRMKGDISGKEDIIIFGNVEGTVDLRSNEVIVGESGRVNANITGRVIIVEGEVKGELRASEQIIVKPSGRVIGDIRAPRVILSDGCQFKGSVDMEEKPLSSNDMRPTPVNKPKPNPLLSPNKTTPPNISSS